MSYTTDDKIGLVIKSAGSMAKCIQIIRKYNPISMAEIKNAIDANHFVFDCDYIDDSGIRRVRRCYDELVKAGAIVEIYEDGDLTTREFISNLIGTYKEIAADTEAMIDAEVAAEGGEED
jgi:hypothetical protein